MRINHIRGPAGSGKSTMLHAIGKEQGAKRCLFVLGCEMSSTAGILRALDNLPDVTTILIDEFNPKTINLKKLAQHERAPQIVVHVVHVAGAK